MTVTPAPPAHVTIRGVPDYYKIYQMWLGKFRQTGNDDHRVLAYHYARVASDMGQATITEDDTLEVYKL